MVSSRLSCNCMYVCMYTHLMATHPIATSTYSVRGLAYCRFRSTWPQRSIPGWVSFLPSLRSPAPSIPPFTAAPVYAASTIVYNSQLNALPPPNKCARLPVSLPGKTKQFKGKHRETKRPGLAVGWGGGGDGLCVMCMHQEKLWNNTERRGGWWMDLFGCGQPPYRSSVRVPAYNRDRTSPPPHCPACVLQASKAYLLAFCQRLQGCLSVLCLMDGRFGFISDTPGEPPPPPQ